MLFTLVPCQCIMTSRVLDKAELRLTKPTRQQIGLLPRRPIRVILDNVGNGYNVGAMFRLCDAMRVEHLTICCPDFTLRKRSISQAAQGTQFWVSWSHSQSTATCVAEARQAGYQIAAVELTSTSIAPEAFIPKFPLCLVIGAELDGVSPTIVTHADVAVAIPMYGMTNSLNLATAAAIVLYEVCKHSPLN